LFICSSFEHTADIVPLFKLSGALGPAYGSSGAQYESSLSTFWGSWAFLIGSLIQWYESLDKHPVEENSPSSSSSSSSSSKIAKH